MSYSVSSFINDRKAALREVEAYIDERLESAARAGQHSMGRVRIVVDMENVSSADLESLISVYKEAGWDDVTCKNNVMEFVSSELNETH
jgi:hypothetical protein